MLSGLQQVLAGLTLVGFCSQGELNEALRIRQEQELPVFEKLDDARSYAVTMGKIADILVLRGELDEALRVRYELQLPAFQKLGKAREIAFAVGKIAQTIMQRNQLSEARQLLLEYLEIHQELGKFENMSRA